MDHLKALSSTTITGAIICQNGAKTMGRALASLHFVDEIIVLDDHSTDQTASIAKNYQARVLAGSYRNFADKRNAILQELHTDWVLYVDADEVVTPELAADIQRVMAAGTPAAYQINRTNYFLGTRMYPDRVDRLFHRSVIKRWTGAVHESPLLTVAPKVIEAPLLHYTHADIDSMLQKTNQWSDIEAELRLKANHPPVAWWRLVRIALTEGWHQFGQLKVARFGRAGLFEGYFQIVDKLIVYTKLWERQQQL